MSILAIPRTSPGVIPAVAGGGPPALVLIGQTVLGADAASITFSAIPQIYKDLVIGWSGRSTNSGSGAVGLSGHFGHGTVDAGSNYGVFQNYNGTSSANVNENPSSRALIGFLQMNNEAAKHFSSGTAEIIDYRDTTSTKQYWMTCAYYGVSVAAYYVLGGGTWRSLSAIDIITFYPDSGNLLAGTKIALYGRG